MDPRTGQALGPTHDQQNLGSGTIAGNLRYLGEFAQFAARQPDGCREPEQLTRHTVEAWLASMQAEGVHVATRKHKISGISVFHDTVHTLGWEQRLLRTTVVISGDGPKALPSRPRFLSEVVMRQCEDDPRQPGPCQQTLPNGYSGLPLVRDCEHANPCLTCPMFLTTPEFLPQHREQRVRTLTIIESARAAGHARIAEKNTRILDNLDKIIDTCERCDDGEVVFDGKVAQLDDAS